MDWTLDKNSYWITNIVEDKPLRKGRPRTPVMERPIEDTEIKTEIMKLKRIIQDRGNWKETSSIIYPILELKKKCNQHYKP